MKARAEPGEYAITDGTRFLGNICPREGKGFEAFDSEGQYICKCDTRDEARRAVISADRRRREGAGQ